MNCLGQFHSTRRAFTLLELLTTIAIIAILAALLLPALRSARGKARNVACASQLKQAGVAFHLWAHDHNDLFPMQVPTNQNGTLEFAQATALNPDASFVFRHFQALSNELAVAKILICPADPRRIPANDFASLRNGNVSYWINPATAFGHPDSPLAGDRNIRTSGHTEWTFLRFGAGDVLEFSAELHGYRGNVLFGDAHVDALDSRALRAAFGSKNSTDVVLTLPQGGGDSAGANAANDSVAGPSANGAASAPNSSSDTSAGNGAGSGGRNSGASQPNPSRGSSNTSAAPAPFPDRAGGAVRPASSETIVIAKLDGTFVTSSVPRQVTNSAMKGGRVGSSESSATNPLMDFIAWLTRAAARGTYWLLFVLLLALIVFEVVRRRAKRKRGSSAE